MALPQNAQIDALFEAILKLEDREDCRLFLEDLCTIKEIRAPARPGRQLRLHRGAHGREQRHREPREPLPRIRPGRLPHDAGAPARARGGLSHGERD